MKKNLCVIPARGGSKRIPRKNVRDFLGKPIISYSIEVAKKSSLFKEIMVSTDDIEIAEISKKYGAKVPFLRSQKNSDDNSTLVDVITEVISSYEEKKNYFTYCCIILPTAPLLEEKSLIIANNLMLKNKCDTVYPVVEYSYPILRFLEIENGKLKRVWPEYEKKRSQDFIEYYHDCGLFYLIDIEKFKKNKSLITKNTIPMIFNEMTIQDIDNQEDWNIAEIKYKYMQKKDI